MIHYIALGLFGLLFSLLLQVYKNYPKIQKSGGFLVAIWLYDNWLRVFVNVCAVIAGVLFSNSLLGMELSYENAFLMGFWTDKIIDAIIERTK